MAIGDVTAHRPTSPILVAEGQRTHHEQIEWDPRWEEHGWFYLSQEFSLPYHLHLEPHQKTLMTVGSSQAFSLTAPHTELLIKIDHDPRLVAQDAILGGLFLISENPQKYISNFMNLAHDGRHSSTFSTLAQAMGDAEQRGLTQAGRTQLLHELAERQGQMSLQGLTQVLVPSFQNIQSPSRSTSSAQTLDWVMDEAQFSSARELYRRAGLLSFQANLFSPQAMAPIATHIRENENEIGMLYFSNLLDMGQSREEKGEQLNHLATLLKTLPFAEGARMLWSSKMGIPLIAVDTEGEPYTYQRDRMDPIDGYAYINMPLPLAREWLDPAQPKLTGDHHFLVLNRMMYRGGTWIDGQLWVEPDVQGINEDPRPDILRRSQNSAPFPEGEQPDYEAIYQARQAAVRGRRREYHGLSGKDVQQLLKRAHRVNDEMGLEAPISQPLIGRVEKRASPRAVIAHPLDQDSITLTRLVRDTYGPDQAEYAHWNGLYTDLRTRLLASQPSWQQHRYQAHWDPTKPPAHWWHLSDEAHHTFHFWRNQPQDTLVVIGGFQAYNLPNEETNQVVRVDYHPSQIAQDAIFSGLVLISPRPDNFTENYLALADPLKQQPTLRRMTDAASPDHRRFLNELGSRTDYLGLARVVDRYATNIGRIRDQNENLTNYERSNFHWLLDPDQYRVVHKMTHEDRITAFQANIFRPETLRPVADFLRDTGHTVDTVYLSDPQDLVHYDRPSSINFEGLGMALRELPLAPDAIVQWTFNAGMPRLFNGDTGGILPIRENVYKDPVDPRQYTYLELPATAITRWLPSTDVHLAEEFFLVEEGRFRPIQYYYGNLHRIIDGEGMMIDGKLTLHPRTPPKNDPRILSASNLVRWQLRFNSPQRAQDIVRRQLSKAEQEGGLPQFQDFLHQTDARLNPEQRGAFRNIVSAVEEEVPGRQFFEGEEFDPRPRELRQLRQIQGVQSLAARRDNLAHRQRAYRQRLRNI